jgi:hypothetical protein
MFEFKLNSNDPTENFRKIEKVLNRLLQKGQTRLGKTVIPPVPIFSREYNMINGEVLRGIFPIDGKITRLSVSVSLKEGVEQGKIVASVSNFLTGIVKHEINVQSGGGVHPVNIEVKQNDIFEVHAKNSEEIEDIIASALFVPTRRTVSIERKQIEDNTDEGSI